MNPAVPYIETVTIDEGTLSFFQVEPIPGLITSRVVRESAGAADVSDAPLPAFFRDAALSLADLEQIIRQHRDAPRLAAAAFVAWRHRTLIAHCRRALSAHATGAA